MATLGLSAGAGDRRLRQAAAAIAVGGLVVAGTAVGLAGTGRMDAQGMIAIPALHDAASDIPIRYTPVCSHGAVPICFNPRAGLDDTVGVGGPGASGPRCRALRGFCVRRRHVCLYTARRSASPERVIVFE
jgi:hypothetical protein